jgi:ParB-like chromosome segregation protein Spo0J
MTVLAGNGTLQAARLNGWDYVPVLFVDDDEKRGRAYALADNAVATLAPWNKTNLETLAVDLSDLDLGIDLNGLADQLLEELASYEAATEEENESPIVPLPGDEPADVNLSRRVIAICRNEDEQIKLVAELKQRGFQAELKTITVK